MTEQELTDVELTRADMTPEQLEQTGPEELAVEEKADGEVPFLEGSDTSLVSEGTVQ